MYMSGLPKEVYQMAQFSPIEDVVLPLLREALPWLEVVSQMTFAQSLPLIIARRTYSGAEGGDPRFIDAGDLVVHTLAEGPDGDADAAVLAEAARIALFDAWRENKQVPGRGYLTRVEVRTPPRRAADWITPQGPVQYADLPELTWRYEATYSISVRRPRHRRP